MNKKGHFSTAVAAGTGMLLAMPSINATTSLLPGIAIIVGAAAGGFSPDFDHKTSTASQLIQFSSKRRAQLRFLALCFVFMGSCIWGWGKSSLLLHTPEWLIQSVPVWLFMGLVCFLAARMRTFVLLAMGILLLWGFSQNQWHWTAAVTGGAFLLLPFVPHRGVIHSPEFGLLLSYSMWLFSSTQGPVIEALLLGFIGGWWAHLISDCFGKEGISSILIPKLKVALKLFQNGGHTEIWISRFCWTGSLLIWILLISRNFHDFGIEISTKFLP